MRSIRKWPLTGLCVVVISLALVLTGCGQTQNNEAQEKDEETMRIVSVVPSVTEILFDLGLEDQIVGVTTNCDYPEAAADYEKVGDWNINVEKLVSLEPDLVIGMESTNGMLLNELSQFGIETLAFEAQSFDEIYEAFMLIGQATNSEKRAQELVNEMQERVDSVVDVVSAIPAEDRVTVFMEVGWEPLYTVGKTSLQHEIIELAGGVNIIEVEKSWVQYNQEQLIEDNPQVIILGTHPHYSAEDVKARIGWQELLAVKEDRIIDDIDTNTLVRPTYRAVLGLEAVAEELYPELF
ncbi:iron complex transport system substrate-binding protein [Desulfitispora alkaliphila]|uniref:ABC transporter substrate-binding protein n=1 Tax=Desulfitispora alkaliphila TaxID=622674 RepID=UPI003D1BF976